ncbi:MAG: 4-hydroxy-3-methylbut-2-enyl diphosphate reductase [Firmicutes bacterium]|nr:4-hydroxy-3-methylbut-2-enyl diphosphate reductase [Bacillota bacterium]
MKPIITIAKNAGFCFGVQNAVNIALETLEKSEGKVFSFGNLIHNELVTNSLKEKGINAAQDLDTIKSGDTVIIRSHGIAKSVEEEMIKRGFNVVDATCKFVKKIHQIVKEYSLNNYHIVIIGQHDHPEVIGIAGYCEKKNFTIIDKKSDLTPLNEHEKLCFVVQTTFDREEFENIKKKISSKVYKLVEQFDTICYTTHERQCEAENLAKKNDIILVIGSKKSSNTTKLFNLSQRYCKDSFFIESICDFSKITQKLENLKKIKNNKTPLNIGIAAGASTPKELVSEAQKVMVKKFEESQNKEFLDGIEDSFVNYKEGKRIVGTVIFANNDGIKLSIGGKKDGFIRKDDVTVEAYNPENYPQGMEIEAVITSKNDPDSGCVLLSSKKVQEQKMGDETVESIRGGEVFEVVCESETKGGLLAKLGNYTVFVPASQVKENFVKDLKPFVGKPLRLTVVEIDDAKKRIIASQKKVLAAERKEREDEFFKHVQPDVIVSGVVKRITNFGAFVSVNDFDCLAHIADLSWKHIKSASDVLKLNETYDFLVTSVDRARGRVALSYKLLQKHPFEKFLEENPIGTICKGKVKSVLPFGAFVEIAPEIEGLVHVSEASHNFVKSINEVLKAGQEVDVCITNIEPHTKKISLSIKAATEAPEGVDMAADSADGKPKRAAKGKSAESVEYSDGGADNNPFASLLKGIEVDEK